MTAANADAGHAALRQTDSPTVERLVHSEAEPAFL
jgi:hypothetical protein